MFKFVFTFWCIWKLPLQLQPQKLGSNTLKCYGKSQLRIWRWKIWGKAPAVGNPLMIWPNSRPFFRLEAWEEHGMAQSGIKFQHVFLKPDFFQKIMIKMNEDSVFLVVNDYKLYNRPTFKEIIPFMVVSSVGFSVPKIERTNGLSGIWMLWRDIDIWKISHPGMCTSPKLNMSPERGSILKKTIIIPKLHWKCGNVNMWFVTIRFLNKQLHTKR